MSEHQIVVIGRGIAGLAAAFELKKAGFPVRVVGPARAAEPPGVGTRAATGISAMKGAVLPQKALFAAKAAGHALLPAWLDEVERIAAGPLIPRTFAGVSELFFDLTGYEGIRARVFHRKFTGCYRAEVLDPIGLMSRGGDLSPFGLAPRGGFFYPRDGWYDPEAALMALEAALANLGVPFTDAAVERLAEHPDAGLEIRAGNGTLRCREAVLAAGVWTDRILAASGIAALPAQTAFAGETLRGKGSGAGTVVTTFNRTSLVAIGGRIQYGSTCYPAASLFAGPDAGKVAELRARYEAHAPLPAFSEVAFGLRARAPDRLPTVGPLFFPSGNRRFWVLTGLYKNGLQLAPLFARDLCRFLTTSTPNGPFLPARFA